MLIGCDAQLPVVADSAVVDLNYPSDRQVEMIEQERLVLQLKEMIRDRENSLASKDADLKVTGIFLFTVFI